MNPISKRSGRCGAAIALVATMTTAMAMAVGSASAQAATPITGGGSSFAQLEIDQWRADTARAPYDLNVGYQSAGSTFGRQKYLTGQFDFAQSDLAFQPEEQAIVASSPRKDFVYVPTSAGGIGFMYNLTGTDGRRVTNLKLSQSNVCRLLTELEIYWDDPSVVAENPGVPLPHNRVRPVVRSDGAGTSYNVSAFCIATAPDVWGRFISNLAAQSSSTSPAFRAGLPTAVWPPAYGAAATAYASDGVANSVANDVTGKDTITYNEEGFALTRGFPNAAVRNAAGNYLQPNAPNVSAALEYASTRPDGTFALQFLAPDPNAYFPVAYSYAIAQTTGFDPAKGHALATFLNYAVTTGQRRAEPLGYARLSNVLVNLALDKITQIPGAPARPTDLGGAPPSPGSTTTPDPPAESDELDGVGASTVTRQLEPWAASLYQTGRTGSIGYVPMGDREGRARFARGEADFAISGTPLTPDDLHALDARHVQVVGAPIAAASMTFFMSGPRPNGIRTYLPGGGDDEPFETTPFSGPLRLPNATAANIILERSGTMLGDPTFVDANTTPPTAFVSAPQPEFLAQSDASATNRYSEEFVHTVAPAEYDAKLAGDAQLPPGVLSETWPFLTTPTRSGAAATASLVAGWQGTTGAIPAGGVMTATPAAEALAQRAEHPTTPLYIAQIQNGAGEWVAPTPASITTAIAQGGGTPLAGLTTPIPGAYPLTWVNRLYAPTSGLGINHTNNIATLIRYAVTSGQAQSEAVGEGRLSAPLVTEALDAADQIVRGNCVGSDRKVVTTPGDGADWPVVGGVARPLLTCAFAGPVPVLPEAPVVTLFLLAGGVAVVTHGARIRRRRAAA